MEKFTYCANKVILKIKQNEPQKSIILPTTSN